jgi:membrane protein required for colicin V production
MTWFDYLLVAVLVLSIGFAFIRGALREIGALIILAVAAGVAYAVIKPVQNAIGSGGSLLMTVAIAGAVGLVAFALIYLAFHIGLRKLALPERAVRLDRMVGAAFGLARGLALVGLGFLAYAYYLDEERRPDGVNRAVTLPIAKAMAGFFEGFAPEGSKLDPNAKPRPPESEANAAHQGYGRGDRAALSEMMTTMTTGDVTVATDAPAASADPIAAVLQEDEPQ